MKFLKALYNLPWAGAMDNVTFLRAQAYLFLCFMVAAFGCFLLAVIGGGISALLDLSALPERILKTGLVYIPYGLVVIVLIVHIIKLSVLRLHDFGLRALWWTLYLYLFGGLASGLAMHFLPERKGLAITLAISLSVALIQYALMFQKSRPQTRYQPVTLFATNRLDLFTKIVTTLYVAMLLFGLSSTLAEYVLSVLTN